MALSNIGNEPRREITESIVATVGYIYLDFFISKSICPYYYDGSDKYPPWWLLIIGLMLFIGIMVPLLLWGFIYLTHDIGDMVCDWLKALKIDPRPRRRQTCIRVN